MDNTEDSRFIEDITLRKRGVVNNNSKDGHGGGQGEGGDDRAGQGDVVGNGHRLEPRAQQIENLESRDLLVKNGHRRNVSYSSVREQRLQDIKIDANTTHSQLISRLSEAVHDLITDVVTKASKACLPPNERTLPRNDISFTQEGHSSEQILARKLFVPRDSILTELLEIDHIRTVYNIFVAILILFSFQTAVYELLEFGRIKLHFDLMAWAFGNFPLVLWIWVLMMGAALFVYPAFNMWMSLRVQGRLGFDYAVLTAYILYMVTFLVLPINTVFDHALPPVSTIIVVLEQIRLMMKVHSFVRENAPKVLININAGNVAAHQTDFSKFLYFLFAPTLLYRDEYPRTKAINWRFVMSNFLQLFFCTFYTYYIFQRFCVPIFGNFNREHVTLKAFVISAFGCTMPGTLVLLIGFFAVLHSWLNAWAEMLRFADRLFYKDWWNSTSFSRYYRTWNIVVHDWLFSYIYQDVYMLMGFQRKYRWFAMFSTFLMSALFHEVIFIVAFKFFYPVLFVMFGLIGVGFMYVTNGRFERSSNIFMWLMLFCGTGLLMCLYSMEWFARKNCAPAQDAIADVFVPRSWFCETGIHPSA